MKEFMMNLKNIGVTFTSSPEGLTILQNDIAIAKKGEIEQLAAANGVILYSVWK